MKFLKPGMAHLRDTNTQQVDAKVFKASVNKIGWKKKITIPYLTSTLQQ